MSTGWIQFVIVGLLVVVAAIYAGRTLFKQLRQPDEDFSGSSSDCGDCAIANSQGVKNPPKKARRV